MALAPGGAAPAPQPAGGKGAAGPAAGRNGAPGPATAAGTGAPGPGVTTGTAPGGAGACQSALAGAGGPASSSGTTGPACRGGSSRTTGPCGEASDSSTGSATSSLVTALPRRNVPARPRPSNVHPSGPQASRACCRDTVGSLTTTSLSVLRPILTVRPCSNWYRRPSQLT